MVPPIYNWRSENTKRFIAEKKFSFVAVESDWPDCYNVNRFVKGMPGSGESAYDVLYSFNRWPTWMWANREVVDLVEWLREHNKNFLKSKKWASMIWMSIVYGSQWRL